MQLNHQLRFLWFSSETVHVCCTEKLIYMYKFLLSIIFHFFFPSLTSHSICCVWTVPFVVVCNICQLARTFQCFNSLTVKKKKIFRIALYILVIGIYVIYVCLIFKLCWLSVLGVGGGGGVGKGLVLGFPQGKGGGGKGMSFFKNLVTIVF